MFYKFFVFLKGTSINFIHIMFYIFKFDYFFSGYKVEVKREFVNGEFIIK